MHAVPAVYAPSKARHERGRLPRRLALRLDFKADVEHRIWRGCHVAAPLAAHVALQKPVERRVHDADAVELRRALRRRVDLVERSDEALVRVLLRVARQLRGRAPRRRQKACRAEGDGVSGVHLGVGYVSGPVAIWIELRAQVIPQ